MTREYSTLDDASEMARAGEFSIGTVVRVGDARFQLATLAGDTPTWTALREAVPGPPLRKFKTLDAVRTAVRCGGLQVDDEIELALDAATVAAVDRVGEEFVLVWSNGRQTAHDFYTDGEGRYDPKPASDPDPVPRSRTLPGDSDARKEIPIAEGCLFYFPAALAAVARMSKIGNDKHNPGEPLHHARGKSTDHENCIVRHTLDARESDGAERLEHMAARAWRALAALQEECEHQGSPLAPNAKEPRHD